MIERLLICFFLFITIRSKLLHGNHCFRYSSKDLIKIRLRRTQGVDWVLVQLFWKSGDVLERGYMIEISKACHGILWKWTYLQWMRQPELDSQDSSNMLKRLTILLAITFWVVLSIPKIFFSNSIFKIIFSATKVVGFEGWFWFIFNGYWMKFCLDPS